MKKPLYPVIFAVCFLTNLTFSQDAPSASTDSFSPAPANATDSPESARRTIVQPLNSAPTGTADRGATARRTIVQATGASATNRRTIVQGTGGTTRGGAGTPARGTPARGAQPAATSPRGSGSAAPAAGTTPPKPQLPSLKENIHLQVRGELVDYYPVDFSITGIGPDFSIAFMLPRSPSAPAVDASIPGATAQAPTLIVATLQATVVQVESGYQVDFTLGYSVPTVTDSGGRAGTQTLQYRNETAKSTLLIKPDSTAEVATANGKKVTLSLTQVPAK